MRNFKKALGIVLSLSLIASAIPASFSDAKVGSNTLTSIILNEEGDGVVNPGDGNEATKPATGSEVTDPATGSEIEDGDTTPEPEDNKPGDENEDNKPGDENEDNKPATESAVNPGDENTPPTDGNMPTGQPPIEPPIDGNKPNNQTPQNTGSQTVVAPATKAAVTTPQAVGPATPAVIYKVDTVLAKDNYEYKVVVEGSTATKGAVNITGLTTTGLTKKTLNVPKSVNINGVSFKIVGIAKKAFTASAALKNVKIGDNVTFIGVKAFQKTKIKTLVLGKKLTTIKKLAFAGCSNLRTVSFPAKVQKICKKAFYNTKKLKAVYFASTSVTKIAKKAFSKASSSIYFVVPSGKKTKYNNLITNSGLKSTTYYTY